MRHQFKMGVMRRRAHVLFTAAAAVVGIGSSAHALVINTLFDSSITGRSDAAQIEAAVNYAAQEYEGLFSNSITLNVQFGVNNTGLGASQGYYILDAPSYTQIKTALQALTSTSAQISSGANLPSSDPNPSQPWQIDSAEAKALGFTDVGNGRSVDGTVMFNQSTTYTVDPFDRTVSGANDLIGVAEHEIAEVMGRTSSGGANLPYILMHYKSPGVRDFAQTGASDYFSVDGGVTNLKVFNFPNGNGSDPQDWADNPANFTPDAYDQSGGPDQQYTLSNVDITVMNVLGYNPTSNSLSWFGGNGDMLTGFDWDATGQAGINPHHGANLTFGSAGETASHAFSSGENWELSDVSDAGLSLTISAGTVKITSTGTNGNGQGILVNQNGSLILSSNGTLSLAGALSIGDSSASTNATASFSGNTSIKIGAVSGTDQTFYVGNDGVGSATQSGNAAVGAGGLRLGNKTSGTGLYSLSNSAALTVSGQEIIGDFGLANFIQSGGTNTSGDGLFIGNETSGDGIYFLSGSSTLSVSNQEDIGDQGPGEFLHSSGLNSVTGDFVLGTFPTGTGSYFLSNTAKLTVSGNETISDEGYATFNQSGGQNKVSGNFYLASSAGATGTFILSGTATLTVAGTEYIADSGTGTFNQSGGANVVSNDVFIGTNNPGVGVYNLSAGTLNVTGREFVGYGLSGTLNQTGGANIIQNGNALYVRDSTSANGTYLLSGSSSLSAAAEYVGHDGGGIFFQSGGTNSSGTLTVGADGDGNGTYFLFANSATLSVSSNEIIGQNGNGGFSLSAGLNSITGQLYVATQSGSTGTFTLSGSGTLSASTGEIIGDGGAGTFNQSGGSNTLGETAEFVIGAGGTGTYYLSGTGVLTGPGFGFEYIGDGGLGIFNQSGGHHIADDLDIGYSSSTGTYILSGTGTLTAAGESVGVTGNGTFNQSGGLNSPGGLNIAENFGSIGTYILSGGTLTTSSVYVGGNLILVGGVGTLNVSGGLLTVPTLTVYNTSGNSIMLSGGTVNIAALNDDAVPRNFDWFGGTLGLTAGVTFDPGAAATSTSAAFGSTLTVGSNMTLNVTGNQIVGGTSAFSLILGGELPGSTPTNVIQGSLVVNSGSTVQMQDDVELPALTAFGEVIGETGTGSFIQSGGTNNIGNSGLQIGVTVGSMGTYSLSDPLAPFFITTLTSTSDETVGYGSTGIFNQTGGTNSFSNGFLYVGYLPGAKGTYNLSGGYLLAAGSEDIGEYGTGAFVQSGGTNHVDNFFTVADQIGSTGSYTLSAGTLSGGIFEYVGAGGAGSFNQSGGANNAVTLDIGDNSGSSGAYTLTNGTLNAEAVNVGVSGNATFNQSGGLNNVGTAFSDLILGVNSGSTGTYTLSGSGSLSVSGFDSYEFVGYSGVGNFNQTGGANTTGSVLFIAVSSGSNGAYTLSGGTLTSPNIYVGGSTTTPGGNGTLTVNQSGQLSVSGTLTVWNTGRVNLDVPNTSVGNLTISGKGIVNLNGTLKINFASPATDPVSSVVSYLKSGYNGGAWTGTAGIISTSITGGTPTLSLGYADGNTDIGTAAGPNQIVVKYTLAGDANLDGLVNFNDLVAVVQNFNKAGADWAHGNFGYGASTNFGDLVAIVQNFNKTLPAPTGSAAELGGITIPLVNRTDVQLPEPAALGIAAFGAGAFLSRRRRR